MESLELTVAAGPDQTSPTDKKRQGKKQSKQEKSEATKKQRPATRALVRWDDDKDKQVMLTMQWACSEVGLKIPWELVAKQIRDIPDRHASVTVADCHTLRIASNNNEPYTEGAIVQHLAKLRGLMIKNKIEVPPSLKRGVVAKIPSMIYAAPTKSKAPPGGAIKTESATILPSKTNSTGSHRATKTTRNRGECKDLMSNEEISDDSIGLQDSDSDGEYGAAGPATKKRKTVGKSAKESKGRRKNKVSKAKSSPYAEEGSPIGKLADEQGYLIVPQDSPEILQSIENQSRVKTRGRKQNYLELSKVSDDEEEEEESEEDIATTETNTVMLDGEVLPRTLVINEIDVNPAATALNYTAAAENSSVGNGSTFEIASSFGPDEATYTTSIGSDYVFNTSYGSSGLDHDFQQHEQPTLIHSGLPASISHKSSTVSNMTNSTGEHAYRGGYTNVYADMQTGDMHQRRNQFNNLGGSQAPLMESSQLAAGQLSMNNPCIFTPSHIGVDYRTSGLQPIVFGNAANFSSQLDNFTQMGQMPVNFQARTADADLPVLDSDLNCNLGTDYFDQAQYHFDTNFREPGDMPEEDIFDTFTNHNTYY